MKNFDECLNTFNEEYEKFLSNYKFLDKDSFFTPQLLSEINKIIDELSNCAYFEINNLDKRKTKLNESFKATLKDYYKIERQRKNELKEKLKAIKDEADIAIANLKKDLLDNKNQFEKNEFDSLNDIDFYIDASNQNIDMFEIECKDNLNRFAYQIDVAKSSYNNNIDTFNAQLEDQLEKVTSIYKTNIEKCDKSYSDLVESYNLIIEEKNRLIEEKKHEYQVAQVELKNKKRQESTDLNDLIRKYSEEKSNKLSEIKAEYVNLQKLDNVEKQGLFDELKNENFKANKDFVQSINELDNKLKDLREKFEKYCNEEYQNKYYSIFDIHVEQEKIIAEFLLNNKNDPKLKTALRKINKQYYNKIAEENNRVEKLIDAAKKSYAKENAEGVYEKKILDISRTSFFAKLNEKQTRDNKYYQEKNNGYENLYNYNAFIATSEYNKQANKLLLDSSIRNLGIEKEIDETDAKYQIQIETLSDVIKKYQLEISISKKLNELNRIYLDDKYNREISFLTVSNLLKIEKCKVLDQYNIRQYELNIQNSNNILDYSKKKINLQNDKYSALKKQDIVISHNQLQNIITNNNYDISLLNHKCLHKQDVSNKEAKHATILNKTNLLNEKFIVELDEYENILQAYVIIYNNIVKAWNDIIDKLYSLDPNSNKLIKRFLTDLLVILKKLILNITDTYKKLVDEEISSHINFDNEFKYKDSIDVLKNRREDEIAVINHKKELLVHESDLLKAKNDDIRLRLFTIQYDDGDKYNRSTRNSLTKQLVSTLKKNNKQLNILDNMIEEINKEALNTEKKYDKQISSLEDEIENDNMPYLSFNKQVNEIIEKTKKIINSEIVSENLTEKEKFKLSIAALDNNILTSLFSNNSAFSEKYQFSYNLALKKIDEEYNEEMESTQKAYDETLDDLKKKYLETNQVELNKINSLLNDRLKLEKHYNDIIMDNDIQHQKDINAILLAKEQSTTQFYTELYAVDDNLTEIENDYAFNIKKQETDYSNNKQQIVDETLAIKEEYNNSLSNYISNRRAIINHLPIAMKENEKELVAQYKEKNKEIDLKLIQSKKDLSLKKTLEKKNLSTIDFNYKTAVLKIEASDKRQKIKEKKNLIKEKNYVVDIIGEN